MSMSVEERRAAAKEMVRNAIICVLLLRVGCDRCEVMIDEANFLLMDYVRRWVPA